MKTKKIIPLLILIIFCCSFSVKAQNNSFNGEWKLNTEKTVLADNQLFLNKVTVKLKSDSLLTTRVYQNYNGEEYPFVENLSLDNKDCKITIYDMPRSTKATFVKGDGSILIESKTTFYSNGGEGNLIAKETWKVDKEGKLLTVDFTNSMEGNESKGTNYYNKVK